MELYKELLINAISNSRVEVTFPDLQINVTEIVEGICYNALSKIKDILDNYELNDSECFMKIEEIILMFEAFGSGSGERHDY